MKLYLSLLLCAFLSLSSYGADRGPDADGPPPAKRLKREGEGEGKGDGDADHASFTTGLTTIVLPMELFDSLKQPERVGTVIATKTLEPGYETKLRQLYPNLTSIMQAKTLVLPRDDLNRMMTNPGPSEHSGPDAERVTTVIIWPCDRDTPIDTAQALGALRGIFPHIMEVVAGQTFTLTPQILTAFTQGVPNARALLTQLVQPDYVTELVWDDGSLMRDDDGDIDFEANRTGLERIMGQFLNLTSLCLDEVDELSKNALLLIRVLKLYEEKNIPLRVLEIMNAYDFEEAETLEKIEEIFRKIFSAASSLNVQSLNLSGSIPNDVFFSVFYGMGKTPLNTPFAHSLQSLDLSDNRLELGRHGVQVSQGLLQIWPNIEHLDISGNRLNEMGLLDIFRFLDRNNRTLKSLDVRRTGDYDDINLLPILIDGLTHLKKTRSDANRDTPLVRNLFVSPNPTILHFRQIMTNFCGANTLVAINVKP